MIAARMAYGNLFLHKAKSIILGTIMCLGIAVLFVGNSLIDTAVDGLHKMFVQGYTGDVMVTGPTSYTTTIFGETAGGEDVIPHIAQYSKYEEYLAKDPRVKATRWRWVSANRLLAQDRHSVSTARAIRTSSPTM